MFFLQIINYIIGWAFLIVFLILVWRIARSGDARTEHMVDMAKTMTDVTRANTEAAQSAAQSARIAVETIHNLITAEARNVIMEAQKESKRDGES